KTPVFRVFETIRREAERYGVPVTSSEVVGLIPNDAIVDCADFFLRLENFSKEQILEEKLRQAGGGAGKADTFVDDVASSSPAPGGGSVAAFAGSLAAALAAMVCRLTVGKKQYAEVKDELSQVRDRADDLRAELTGLVEKDKEAFDAVMAAFKEGGETLENATKHAADIPLTVMQKSLEAMELALVVAKKGNQNSISDAGVAGLMGQAAIEGAGYNVKINLTSLEDKGYVEKMKTEVESLRKKGEQVASEIRSTVEAAL
ncbi:hypothetical protein GF420_00470, partial [candidate division GN15 bacterium]|nr:hypothetical protein [candidate division GN15 bacterium]